MSPTIDEDLVRHIGKLSRIELSDEQVQTFRRQLASILEYFGKLRELDTEGIEPMAHATELHNVLADDVPGESLSPQQALANAPDRDGDFFKVPKVIGDSQ
ncbi:MAG TPA: Asp-tRNA(Asn)/Glu-tRNA(Gln) amidotransferase subunit GatC [Phycisphaerae bacterium]|nr:Asp-tRNA(Asn)/Glu-tRNA(Gln) amidotransferase subunit GatC [Phycisphaerae bacterium]